MTSQWTKYTVRHTNLEMAQFSVTNQKIFLYKFWALQIKPCEDTNFRFTAPHSLLTHVQRSTSENREWGSTEACVEKSLEISRPWSRNGLADLRESRDNSLSHYSCLRACVIEARSNQHTCTQSWTHTCYCKTTAKICQTPSFNCSTSVNCHWDLLGKI